MTHGLAHSTVDSTWLLFILIKAVVPEPGSRNKTVGIRLLSGIKTPFTQPLTFFLTHLVSFFHLTIKNMLYNTAKSPHTLPRKLYFPTGETETTHPRS